MHKDDSVEVIDLIFWYDHTQRQQWLYYVTASWVPCIYMHYVRAIISSAKRREVIGEWHEG